MKHIFIVNPMAGAGAVENEIKSKLSEYENDYDIEIYETKAPKDSTQYIKSYCTNNPDTDVCFYACGGDGTVNEVASGVVKFKNAAMSVYACGSGNDFVKYYGGKDNFLDIGKLLRGKEKKIDIIKAGDNYSINVLNFGFDTCVAQTMQKVKRKAVIGGKRAYTTGIFNALMRAMKNTCSVCADGEKLNNGKMLLCTISNAQYVGGTFRCGPKARNDDGYLDVCLVKPISRLKFVKLLGPYTNGEHIDNPKFSDCVVYRRAKKVAVTAPKGFCASYDGEIIENNSFIAEVIEKAVRFIVPEGAEEIGTL